MSDRIEPNPKFGLPAGATHGDTPVCGICDTIKVPTHTVERFLVCPHCDTKGCPSMCGVCEDGKKGLPRIPIGNEHWRD